MMIEFSRKPLGSYVLGRKRAVKLLSLSDWPLFFSSARNKTKQILNSKPTWGTLQMHPNWTAAELSVEIEIAIAIAVKLRGQLSSRRLPGTLYRCVLALSAQLTDHQGCLSAVYTAHLINLVSSSIWQAVCLPPILPSSSFLVVMMMIALAWNETSPVSFFSSHFGKCECGKMTFVAAAAF